MKVSEKELTETQKCNEGLVKTSLAKENNIFVAEKNECNISVNTDLLKGTSLGFSYIVIFQDAQKQEFI